MQGLLGRLLPCDSGDVASLLRFAHVCTEGYTSDPFHRIAMS